MRAKPNSCAGCAIVSHGTDFSRIEGTGANGVMLVGEASGENEARECLPFRPYANAGSILQRTLREMGLDRQQFSITNAVRCRPRRDWLEKSPWEYSAINHCRPNLVAAIAEHKPRVIVALGGTALRTLTGMAGEALGITHLAGYVLPCTIGDSHVQVDDGVLLAAGNDSQQPGDLLHPKTHATPVIGDFHPSYIRRGKASHRGIFARILKRALNIAAGRDTNYLWNIDPEEPHASLTYQTHPSLDEARGFLQRVRDSSGAVVSYDIETAESASLDEDAREGFSNTDIRLVQFSIAPGEGIAFPWDGGYREIARDILHTPNVKCGHNVWLFDNKVLRAAGEREGLDLRPRGTVHDTLAMFHHWQPDLPAHLQFAAQFVQFPFPWKHLAATNIEFYSTCDVDATLRVYKMLERTLTRDEIMGDDTCGYLGQVAAVRPILAAMEDRGLPIDNDARLALDVEFGIAQEALGKELAERAPVACCRVQPKEGYKGVPPEVRAKLKEWGMEWEAYPSSGGPLAYSNISRERFKESGDGGERYAYQRREFSVAAVDAASGEPVSVPTTRWCRVYDFNPNSNPQIKAYMVAKGHPIPKSREEDDEGNRKDTTNKKELQRLSRKTGDTFYLKVIQYRELTKARGTYVQGFVPAADGCVHTTFTFDTAIAQLSSRNPCVQQFPKHGTSEFQRRLFAAMRKMVAAKSGKVLLEIDYRSCHVLTLGFLAGDATWMRLARLDMHSFITGLVLNLWDTSILRESDDELLARFKWLKSNPEWKHIRDDQAKHADLGVGNGLKAKGLFERYPEEFGTQKRAQAFLTALMNLAPRVFKWQENMKDTAHDQQELKSPFGHLRRFYEVKRWDTRKMDWGHGDQAEEAVAYMLSNVAHAHMRESMKELERRGYNERYNLCNQVHDSLLFHLDESLLDQCLADVVPVMTAPSKVLRSPLAPNGLHIDVEASAGPNWSEMREISLPKLAPVMV